MDDFHKNATPMKLKKLQRRRTALTCIPLENYDEQRRPSTSNSTRRQGSVDMSEGRQRPAGFALGADHRELCCSVSSPYPYNDAVLSRTPEKSQSPNKSKEKLPVKNESETDQQQHHYHQQQDHHNHHHHLYQRHQHRTPRKTLAPTLSLHGDSLLCRAAEKDFEYGEQFLQELHRKCRQVEQRGGGHAAISASGLPKAGTIIDSKINEWYASCQNSITPVTPRRRTFLKSSSVKARALNSMPNSFDEDDVIPGKPEQLKVEESTSADRNETARTRSEFPSACFERRKAIFDMTGLNNDSNSCSTTSKETCNQKRERKQSSADLGVHYPGDLLSQVRPRKKPLTSRNTIADFAASRVRQTSTVSLLSTTEQDKKAKTPFSLIKRIEKKGHSRSKDGDLSEVLQNLKRSEFKDDLLERLKKVRWYNLLSSSKPSTSSCPPPAADDDNDEGDSSDGSRRRSDDIGDRREESEAQQLASGLSDIERKRREAVWELFTSECVFLIDHLMVLKHCFMEPLKEVQVEGHLMVAEPRDLFGNLDEVCLVTHTFCVEFIKMLLKDATETEVGQTKVLLKALSRFCQLTRDGEVYHEYCLNYSKAMNCLEQLRKNEDFVEFEKWCARDSRCHRLYLTDLLIAPMQHCTKVPLLLSNIIKYTQDEDDRQRIRVTSQKLEASLKNLEAKMSWLKNFERMQEIQSQIVWLPITELEPKSYIPEFIRPLLYRQPCERLLANPTRQLLYEGPVSLIEISKTVDMYMFLFDDILLLTKVKKGSKKVTCTNLAPKIINKNPEGPCSNPYSSKSDGTFLVVHRQPISLDRFVIHSIQSSDVNDSWISQASAPDWVTSPQGQGSNPSMVYHPYGQRGFHNLGSDYYHLFDAVDEDANSIENFQTTRSSILTACVPSMTAFLKNSFVIIQITRFQQVIAVYTLQAPNEASKIAWTSRIAAAQHRYNHNYRSRSSSSSLVISPTQGADDETDIDDLEGVTFPQKLNGKKPPQQSRSPDDLAEENVLHRGQNVVRKGRTTSQDTDEDLEDDEGLNGDEDLDEPEIEEETTRKKDHGRHARSRTAKQRDSEIGLLDDVFESFGGEEFHGKSHRFRTKTLSKKNKHYSRHLTEDSKSLGTSLSRHNLCGSAFTGCSGFGLKKSALTSSILSNQFSPYAGLANSSYDTFDSFSVNRFDIHERRPALHVESVDLPPSLDALVAASMPAYTTNAQVNQRRQKHVNQRSHPNIQDRTSGRQKGDDLYGSRDLSGRFVSTLAPVKLKVGDECEARESSATLPPPSPKRIDIIVSHVSTQAVPELVITTSDIGEASKASPIAPLKQALRNTYSVPLSSEFPSIPRPRPLKQSPLLSVDSPSRTTGALQPPGHHPKLTSTLSLGPKTVPVGNLIPIEPLLSLESLIYSSSSAGNVSTIGQSPKSPAIIQPASSVSQRYIHLGQGVSSQAIFECSETSRFDQPQSNEGVLRATSVMGLQKSSESENTSFADLSTLLQPSAFKMSTGKAASSVALDSENRFLFDKPSQATSQMSDKISQNLDIFDPVKSSTMNRAYSNDTMLNVCQSQAYKPCLSTLELGFSNQSDSGSLHQPIEPKGAVQKPVTAPPPSRTDDSEQRYGRSKSMKCRITMDTITEKNIQSKSGDPSRR